MNLLHLNSYYIDNHLYSMLYKELSDQNNQNVFIPIKQNREPENTIQAKGLILTFDKCINSKHVILYFSKIKSTFRKLEKSYKFNEIDIIHAHNLYTDGALAYRLFKKHGLPYIVAIRSTDITLQYKYMLHRRHFIHKVLKHASQVVFISEANKDLLFPMLPKQVKADIDKKYAITPNGIDKFWFNHLQFRPEKKRNGIINILYVGQIIKRKNILKLIDAIKILNSSNTLSYKLTIVGDKHIDEQPFFDEFLTAISGQSFIDYKGVIKDKNVLLNIFRSSDIFVLPAVRELFGLVYIEALSQGIPVLYVGKEGISSYLDGKNVGEALFPNSTEDIVDKIALIISKYDNYNGFEEVVDQFRWDRISRLYQEMYNTCKLSK